MKTSYKGHSKKSGVYKITNLVNNKFYIGSAKEFKRRYKGHLRSLEKGTHHNKYLQYAFNKHGSDNFLFEVVKVVKGNRCQRLKAEEKLIKKYFDDQGSCYNVRKDTSDTGPWSKNPEETRKKLSKASKRAWDKDDGSRRKKTSIQFKKMWENEEYRNKKLKQITGRVNSDEQKRNMSIAALNRKPDSDKTKEIKKLAAIKRLKNPKERERLRQISINRPPMSQEIKGKISAAHKGRKCTEETKEKIRQNHIKKGVGPSVKTLEAASKKNSKVWNVYLLDPSDKIVLLKSNAAKFAKENGITSAGLHKLLTKNIKTHKGWKLYNEQIK